MSDTPEIIYLIPGEYDGEAGLVWCDDPAPDEHCDPSEAVEYVRKDKHDEQIAVFRTERDSALNAEVVAWGEVDALSRQLERTQTDAQELTGDVEQARKIITDLVEYAECNDPGNPHIGRAKGFLSGGVDD